MKHSFLKSRLAVKISLFALFAIFFSTGILVGGSQSTPEGGVVNIYSYRQPILLEPVLEAFTASTGIQTNVVYADNGILERLQAEGANSPADILMTVDIGRLKALVDGGVTQGVNSSVLYDRVPESYRDPNGHWFALTSRARIIYASKARVPEGSITRYEDLADPMWEGKIVTRPGDHPYNLALFASMVTAHGMEGAREWLTGLKANLARSPQGNDRAQVKAIFDGEADIAVGNSYYYGKMLDDPEQVPWAESVYLIFPNQEDRGTHINVSGMAMTQNAPNMENALALMEFLVSDEAQTIYAEQNNEYPVVPDAPWSDRVASWGRFKPDEQPLLEIAEKRVDALTLVNEIGYND